MVRQARPEFIARVVSGDTSNKEITRRGYGQAYIKSPFDAERMIEFRAAEREAKQSKRGLWGPRP